MAEVAVGKRVRVGLDLGEWDGGVLSDVRYVYFGGWGCRMTVDGREPVCTCDDALTVSANV